MIHPHTELRFISPEIGHGVFATALIPRGTIVWVQDPLDREIPPEEVAALPPELRERMSRYCYRNSRGEYVLCWDHNRYVNHSFNSNCIMTPYHLELAVRDIQAGEELTDDYGYLNILEPFEAFDEGHPRKTVLPDDLLRHHAEWDGRLEGAFGAVTAVGQPLRGLLRDAVWEALTHIAEGRRTARSIRDCFFDSGPPA